jgi:UPF0716 protein FxsA
MALVLLLLFVVVPLVELYVIVQVGQQIGVLPTIGLLLLVSFLGAWLVKREGMRTWRAFRLALQEGRVPARETADGALVVLGGALLLAPGFVTDVVGALCVLPPTRVVMRRLLFGAAASRLGLGRYAATAEGVRRVRATRAPAADRRAANAAPADDARPPALPPE